MTRTEQELMRAMGLTEVDLNPQPSAQDLAAEAYLLAEYNRILIEMMMEES